MASSHKSKNCLAVQSASLPENCLILMCVGITRIGAGIMCEGCCVMLVGGGNEAW